MSDVHHNVASVLSDRELVWFVPEQSVREAAETLSTRDIGAAPVLADGRLVGVFSERDIVKKVVAVGRDYNALKVADIMTPDPKTVTADASLVAAFGTMVDGKFRHLPVIEGDGKVIAMLSMRDIPAEHRIMHRQWTECMTTTSVTIESVDED